MEVRLILCPIDFSEFSARALRHAQSLAEHYKAKLVALHTVELYQFPFLGFAASAGAYDDFCRAAREGGGKHLDQFVKNHGRPEIRTELAVREGIAPDSILMFAESERADVIVMGTHGRRGYDRLMLGSVTDRVMRRACCPVLAVCKRVGESTVEGEERGQGHHLHRILFCADFSENSRRALDYAISVSDEYGAELTLLHILEDGASSMKTESATAAAAAQLEQLVPREKSKAFQIKTAVRTGKPFRQIIEFAAENKMDMISMGVRGRGAVDSAVFGSTTYRVIQLGPCPVLAVHG